MAFYTEVQNAVDEFIDALSDPLRLLNHKIHDNPELAYQEHDAHDTICNFLFLQGFPVKRHAYGLRTAFEARVGMKEGRCVNFNAEYDALPEIGHACGHNLIATASVTAFVALASVIRKFKLPGQVQLLGTPAEEDGGGKIDLIKAGAYKGVDVSMMVHPVPDRDFLKRDVVGIAGRSSSACFDITAIYSGESAHAAASPWDGLNALDALVSAYNNISMLRQQITPDERIHGAILQAPIVTNVIPEMTRTKYTIRSRTVTSARSLGIKVRRCLEAGALATNCLVDIEESKMFADLLVNSPLCKEFQQQMLDYDVPLAAADEVPMAGSTDQGNVSQIVPALHALIGISVSDGEGNHTRQFNAAAGMDKAHGRMLKAGKAMAMLGCRLLLDDELYAKVHNAFAQAKAEGAVAR